MKYILLFSIISLLLFHEISGQPTNTHKTDSTGIYFYSLDSLMELLPNIDKFDKVLIHIPHRTMNSNFNRISNREVIVYSNISTKRLRKNKLRDNNLLIEVLPISIDRNRISSAFSVHKKMNGKYNLYGNGFYLFKYEWNNESRIYELTKIQEGAML